MVHRKKPARMAQKAEFPRLVTTGQAANRPRARVIGAEKRPLNDIYHHLLTISWNRFIAFAALVYVAINLLFAALFMVDPGGVAGLRPGQPADAFFFSIQTFGTIGYGAMYPKDLWANLLVSVESFVGLGAVAVLTGLIFARVSRPTARVMFSKVAVITPYEGVPTLIFRCANQRGNQILEADITISLAHQVTTLEGLTMRRMEDMKPLRSRSPLLSLTWMITHRIDETSPLFGATPESLALERGEVVVMLSGIDDVSAQRIHARHSYVASDIVWNRQLADIIYLDEEGGRVVNYDQFHELKPAPTDPSLPG